MIRGAQNRIGVVLSTLGVGVFALLLAFALIRLSEIERDMRVEATQNMLWVISQAQVASLRLSDTIANYALDPTDTPELQRRYDVFLSRIALLDSGPQRRQMERLGFSAELEALTRSAETLAPLLDRLGQGDTAAARAAHDVLAPHNGSLGRAANAAMVAEWEGLGARLDTYRSQLWHIIASLAGISLIGGFLSLRLLLALRETQKRSLLLENEKAFSELVIGSSGEGVLVVDLDLRCTVWNAAMEQLFSVPPDRSVGQSLGDISGFFNIEPVREALVEGLAGRSTTLFDQVFFQPAEAEPLYLYLRCFPLRSGSDIIGAIVFVSDVTERRTAQIELSRHRDHLEELVRARTRELDEALARERAAADLYRNFAAMVSHQFRTPLAIIDSALQRMMRRRQSITPSELEERAGRARQAITRLTGLVESTLDAARLDAGQVDVRAQPCDLVQLAASVCERQTETAPDRDILVHHDGTSPITVLCDSAHAEHILINLLANAAKYSPPGTPVHVAFGLEGPFAQCLVTNSGCPIDPCESQRLFERYFRGENANGVPGTGIGLYMARTLARMQGGDVSLLASSDDRTTFALSLPLAPASSPGYPASRRTSEVTA
ncbi:sensor histidine kinase [Pelagibacterium montanilacus]|uniref:sensor histidine kinase n=1 Tax=Pelagibacterium montanilacus TaxID=2185280 RepID=UPI0013DF8D68|nr:PAS domain-containing sensor histidine kinase [Pelagibacterium montanilacus]